MTLTERIIALSKEINELAAKIDQLIAMIDSEEVEAITPVDDDNALVTALLNCESVQRDLDTIKMDLPPQISNRIPDNENDIVQVKELVRACERYNYVAEMVKVVGFYEGDSLAYREVLRVAGQ